MSTEYNFRSAFVNGFNREDVIAYIEGLQKELLNANAGREKLQADYMTARKAAENYYANLNAALAHIKTLEAQITQLNRDAANRPVETAVQAAPPPAVSAHKDDDETVVIDENTLLLQNIEEKIESLLHDAGSLTDTAAQTAQQIAGGYAQQTQSLIGATAENLAGLRAELEVLSGKINDKLNILAEKIDELSTITAVKQEPERNSDILPPGADESSGPGFVSSLENYASSNPGGETAADADECIIEVETETASPDFIIYPSDADMTKASNKAAQSEAPVQQDAEVQYSASTQDETVSQQAAVSVIQDTQPDIPAQTLPPVQPPLPPQPADDFPGNIPDATLLESVDTQPASAQLSDVTDVTPMQEALETQEDAFEFEGGNSPSAAAATAQQGDSARLLDLYGKPPVTASQAEETDYSALLSDNTLAPVPDENSQLTPEEIEKLMEMFPDDGETASD